MNALTSIVSDTATMLRRDLMHSKRSMAILLSQLLVPVVMLLLFNYVFGGAIRAGMGSAAEGGDYINYLAPAVLLMTVGTGCSMTALQLVMDMNAGIITRFRTMPIAPVSVLSGQVLGSLIRTMLIVTVVLGVALLMGFRPTANVGGWLAALGLTALFSLGVTWMGVAFALVGKTPAGANSLGLIFQLLAFTSSAFVSTASMAGWVRWFAQYQPFTPITDTLRGLLLGTANSGGSALLAIAWCLALTLLGGLWAQAMYKREPTLQQ